MSFINWIKGVWNKMFVNTAEKVFDVDIKENTMMDYKITEWMHAYEGRPAWVSKDNNIKSIKFPKAICSETARLTTMALGLQFDGGERAIWLQKQYDSYVMPRLRNWVEFGCEVGTVILKPSAKGVDLFLPGQFRIVNSENGLITDIVFQDSYSEKNGLIDKYYTKLERHSFMNARVRMGETEEYKDVTYYRVQNKAFLSNINSSIGHEINLKDTKWGGLLPDTYITKTDESRLDTMLFGVFKMPAANDIDITSPLGVSVFSDAVEEIKDLDIAYSRNSQEIYDSESIELIDDRLMSTAGKKVGTSEISLPHHVHNVYGLSEKEFYQAIERPLKTNDRIVGINNQLSFIGYKCGYSNGYFVFDQKTGMITATQVESDDRRTIQLIKDIRDSLKNCLDDLFYAQSVFADLYNLAPIGDYETVYDFGDITYNVDEDRMRWWQYVTTGKVAFWRYLVKFEGYSEEEAKEIQAEQEQTKKEDLFAEE